MTWVREKLQLFSFDSKQLLRGINWLVWRTTLRGSEVFCVHVLYSAIAPLVFKGIFFLQSCPWKPLLKQNLTQRHEQIKEKKKELSCLAESRGWRSRILAGQFIFLTSNSCSIVQLPHSFIHPFIHSEWVYFPIAAVTNDHKSLFCDLKQYKLVLL